MANKNKQKRIKTEKYHTEEQEEIIRFVKILAILILLVLAVYFFTRIFVTKDLFNKKEEENAAIPGEVNYSTTLIGNMLNKSEDEYYVLMYDTTDLSAAYYSGFITNYQRNKDALKIYFADLNNGFNKKYVTENKDEVMINTTDFDKFKVGKLGLIKISNGKIEKTMTDEEEIAKELEYKKPTTT